MKKHKGQTKSEKILGSSSEATKEYIKQHTSVGQMYYMHLEREREKLKEIIKQKSKDISIKDFLK